MSGKMFDLIFGGNVAATFGQSANMANNAQWQQWAANQAMNAWSTPLPRPPGIYWRRTGGKTHTVEVVR